MMTQNDSSAWSSIIQASKPVKETLEWSSYKNILDCAAYSPYFALTDHLFVFLDEIQICWASLGNVKNWLNHSGENPK